jgi:3-(3-hydroxy-phenyl)propionate hydroxylase
MVSVDVLGYQLPSYEFAPPPELSGEDCGPYPVVVVGAGLTGLTLAAELGMRGVPVVVLEQGSSLGASGVASRGIAYAKRTLEIFDRIGIAERVREKGQTWSEGRIYDGLDELYRFEIQPEADQKWPAFVNVQQFYVEEYLVERTRQLGNVDVRWRSRVTAAEPSDDLVRLTVTTPEGDYGLDARHVVACDGARGSVRRLLGISAPLAQFEDTWAIVDVRVDLPGLQRRLWLNSPVIDGGAAIMHCMADGVVRADWQIGQLSDPASETEPARVHDRLAAFLGRDVPFEIVSISHWGYRCRVMDRLVHGRVAFAGDAAHEIPPFGARGGNSGIQDAENLAWKLEAVINGRCSAALLDTYALERGQAARENALLSCRAQAFITPRSRVGRVLRDAVIALAREHQFAHQLLNTGRPSTPTTYDGTPLQLPDTDHFDGGPTPGAAAEDGPFDGGFLLDRRTGGFLALHFPGQHASLGPAGPLEIGGFRIGHVVVPQQDDTRVLYDRYRAAGGATYVLRPDSHVAARIRPPSMAAAGTIVARLMQSAGC